MNTRKFTHLSLLYQDSAARLVRKSGGNSRAVEPRRVLCSEAWLGFIFKDLKFCKQAFCRGSSCRTQAGYTKTHQISTSKTDRCDLFNWKTIQKISKISMALWRASPPRGFCFVTQRRGQPSPCASSVIAATRVGRPNCDACPSYSHSMRTLPARPSTNPLPPSDNNDEIALFISATP